MLALVIVGAALASSTHVIELRADSLSLDGVAITALTNGAFAPADLDRAERVLPVVAKLPPPRVDDRIVLAVAPAVPASTVIAVVRTCMSRGYIEPVTLRALDDVSAKHARRVRVKELGVDVELPMPEGTGAVVSVTVDKGAVRVGERTVRSKRGQVDARALKKELAELTRESPTSGQTARVDVRGATGAELLAIARGLQDAQLRPVLFETVAD